MRTSFISTALVAVVIAPTVFAKLNILLTNDDGWATANIRAAKTYLEKSGHNVLLVAPSNQESGTGGTSKLPTTDITEEGGEFGTIAAGAPYYGQDSDDSSIWYFNATPAACAAWGIDVIGPKYFKGNQIDLVVSGPNEGNNLGPSTFTGSGTIGATYTSVARGYPAVAFSAADLTDRSYEEWKDTDDDIATINAKLVQVLVNQLESSLGKFQNRLLPKGVGLNVNFPVVNSTYVSPEFVNTRLTGSATVPKLSIGSDGFPSGDYIRTDAVNTAYNGDTSLPGETEAVANGKASVTVFTIDYDAPTEIARSVQSAYSGIINKQNLT